MDESSGSRPQTPKMSGSTCWDIVRAPEERTDGYPFFSPPPHIRAIEQLVEFGDGRVVEVLEDLAQRDEVKEARADLLELIKTVRERLTQ